MEIAFKLLVLIAQLCAVCAIGAAIADHVVEPVVQRRRRSRQKGDA